MKTNLKLHSQLLLLLLLLGPGSAFAQSPNARLLTTFTNPTPPAFSGFFGGSVAAFGDDRVLIGAEGTGQANLFSLNGTLLTTFTVPDPMAASFGGAVVAVGDRVLINAYGYHVGSDQVGRAYLFNTNGTLLTTFTNPNPAKVQAFGFSMAALGSDRVLIGGPANGNKGAPYLGAVYVFGTNGTLLNTITNPNSAAFTGVGNLVAAMGNDRVLVGAAYGNPGVAYIFSTNGTLLTTFTNPAPVDGDYFGSSMAAVGSDRVVISAPSDLGGGAGVAYLFSTNGTLLTTFTNPTPESGDSFGYSVAAVGSSRVLIGADYDNTGAARTGAAYLFSTNGTLLNTITNPTPENADGFGFAVAAVGKDQVIIGAPLDNTGAVQAGSAYLFDLPYTPLSIARNGAVVSVNWITAETGLTLQQTALLGVPTVWNDTTNSVSVNGLTNVVQQALATTNRFFRLHRP